MKQYSFDYILSLLNSITEGNWSVNQFGDKVETDGSPLLWVCHDVINEEDTKFIAEAPNLVRFLLTKVIESNPTILVGKVINEHKIIEYGSVESYEYVQEYYVVETSSNKTEKIPLAEFLKGIYNATN